MSGMYLLIICLQASGAECTSRTIVPYANKAECTAARLETGLPLPDKNYAPAYKGQSTAYCMPLERLEAVEAPEPPRPQAKRTTYQRDKHGRVVSFTF